MNTTYSAVIHKEKDLYVAECPEVGTASQGYTIEEAVDNLREATQVYREVFPLKNVLHSIFDQENASPRRHGGTERRLRESASAGMVAKNGLRPARGGGFTQRLSGRGRGVEVTNASLLE